MSVKKIGQIFFISLIIISSLFMYFKFFKKTEKVEKQTEMVEEEIYQSNIIKDVNYTTKDADGNEYIIRAMQAEIDYANPNVLFLTEVNALIRLNTSENIIITLSTIIIIP